MSSLLTKELYPTVKASLAAPARQKGLSDAIGRFLEINAEKISQAGPVKRIMFTDSEKNAVYTATGLSPEQIKAVIAKSSELKAAGETMANPFNTAITLAIKYFTEVGNKKMLDGCLIYMTMSMYPSIHYKYFQYEPNQQVMDYTINNLSNKFKIRHHGTIYAVLVETTEGTYALHKPRLKTGSDKEILRFVADVKTRQNSLMKKLAVEFYANKEKNVFMNSDGDSYEEDNFYEADSNSYVINRISSKVVLNLTVNGPDIRFINLAAQFCNVSKSELRNYLTSMVTNEHRADIEKIVESILFLYIYDEKRPAEELGTNRFLMHSLEIYKKSNTTDENVIKIKDVLNKWLEELGTYKKTQRLATINDFRRALFVFFVFTIQHSAK